MITTFAMKAMVMLILSAVIKISSRMVDIATVATVDSTYLIS
jgi:hypothetical protein